MTLGAVEGDDRGGCCGRGVEFGAKLVEELGFEHGDVNSIDDAELLVVEGLGGSSSPVRWDRAGSVRMADFMARRARESRIRAEAALMPSASAA